jgi:putative Ca2+/H+ antiporter (TMEM165/GDT1 family)
LLTSDQQKPADLPEKPHDIPHPKPNGYSDSEGLESPTTLHKSPTSAADTALEEEAGGVIQPFHSFVLSLTMILVSEIGDKTFLIAALMAMRHPRLLVFTAAFGALVVMTVLSAVLGHAVPTLIPERLTHFAAAILFLIFGAKMLREGLAMDPNEGVGEEMKEVEMELEEKEHDMARKHSKRRSSNAVSPYALEAGRGRRSRSDSRLPAPPRSPSSSPSRSPSPSGTSLKGMIDGMSNLFGLLLSPAWVQTFVMTFLGEWGDRSQIATIAMAAGNDYWWVTLGALLGHMCCTGVAVIGGRAIAGKVSLRVGKFFRLLPIKTSITDTVCSHTRRSYCIFGVRIHLFCRSYDALVSFLHCATVFIWACKLGVGWKRSSYNQLAEQGHHGLETSQYHMFVSLSVYV